MAGTHGSTLEATRAASVDNLEPVGAGAASWIPNGQAIQVDKPAVAAPSPPEATPGSAPTTPGTNVAAAETPSGPAWEAVEVKPNPAVEVTLGPEVRPAVEATSPEWIPGSVPTTQAIKVVLPVKLRRAPRALPQTRPEDRVLQGIHWPLDKRGKHGAFLVGVPLPIQVPPAQTGDQLVVVAKDADKEAKVFQALGNARQSLQAHRHAHLKVQAVTLPSCQTMVGRALPTYSKSLQTA